MKPETPDIRAMGGEVVDAPRTRRRKFALGVALSGLSLSAILAATSLTWGVGGLVVEAAAFAAIAAWVALPFAVVAAAIWIGRCFPVGGLLAAAVAAYGTVVTFQRAAEDPLAAVPVVLLLSPLYVAAGTAVPLAAEWLVRDAFRSRRVRSELGAAVPLTGHRRPLAGGRRRSEAA